MIRISSMMSKEVPKQVMNDKFLFDSLMDSALPGADNQYLTKEQLKATIHEEVA